MIGIAGAYSGCQIEVRGRGQVGKCAGRPGAVFHAQKQVVELGIAFDEGVFFGIASDHQFHVRAETEMTADVQEFEVMNTAETVVVGQIHHPTHEVIVAQAAVRGTQGARIEYPQGGCQAQLGLPAAAPEVEETLRRNDSAVDDGRGRQALGAERAHDEIREPRAGGAAGDPELFRRRAQKARRFAEAQERLETARAKLEAHLPPGVSLEPFIERLEATDWAEKEGDAERRRSDLEAFKKEEEEKVKV